MRSIITILIFIFHSPFLFADEKLNWSIPDGWKVGHQEGNMIELIKESETIGSWTRLITFQQYEANEKTNGIAWIKMMEQGFAKGCKEVELIPLRNGDQNGYEIAHAILSCTTNKSNGKGEIYQVKTIKGKTRFYVVQYAYRVPPFEKGSLPLEKEEVDKTINYISQLLIVGS